MPSREIIDVQEISEADDQANPGQSSPPVEGQSAAKSNSGGSRKPQKRKITPMTENKKQTEAPKKKGKQQPGIMSFFGNKTAPSSSSSKPPATPFASNDKSPSSKKNSASAASSSCKKQPQASATKTASTTTTARSAPAKSTETDSTPAEAKESTKKNDGTSNSTSYKSRHSKMDFKDIAVGKLSSSHQASKKKINPMRLLEEDKKMEPIPHSKEELEAMLPKVPPLSAVQLLATQPGPSSSSSKSSSAKDDDDDDGKAVEVDMPLSQEDDSCGFGALRSQLVEKFDDQQQTNTNKDPAPADGEAKLDDGDNPVSGGDEAAKTSTVEAKDEEMPDAAGNEPGDIVDTKKKPETAEENSNKNNDKDPADDKMEVEVGDADEASQVSQLDDTSQVSRRDHHASQSSIEQPVDTTSASMDAMSHKSSSKAGAPTKLDKQEAMVVKYRAQAMELVAKARAGLDAEDISIPSPSTEGITFDSPSTFPNDAVPHLACLLEGSKLPLSELAAHACNKLNEAFNSESLSAEMVSDKIKVLANRKAAIKNPEIAKGVMGTNNLPKGIVAAEDGNLDHMWRWEVTSLDYLPQGAVKQIKQARAARAKLMKRYNATASLLRALDDSIKLLRDSSDEPNREDTEKALAKVSKEEERVLKFEQEAEKARHKKQKDAEKTIKSQQSEEKKRAAEEKKREKEEAKQKKAREKEESKKKKEEEARLQQEKKERASAKRKQRMISFFGAAKSPPPKASKPRSNSFTAATATTNNTTATATDGGDNSVMAINGFDVDGFRARINSSQSHATKQLQPFKSISKRARASRRRKTKLVKLTVFESGQNADDPFAQQGFSKQVEKEFRNRNKFLSFHKDVRPPYHGTWSKKATKNLGKHPWTKQSGLDYDVDSEAEWEEGDEDPGEDIENDAKDEEEERAFDREEEGDTKAYNYQDGWLQQDDDIIGEDVAEMDDDTKNLMKASRNQSEVTTKQPICIVPPAVGGLPIAEAMEQDDPQLVARIKGFSVEEACKLVSAHRSFIFADADIFLDAFPPPLVEECEGSAAATGSPQSKEPSKDDLRTCARFLHHSRHASKPVAVEELRAAHPAATASRAQATRVLDSIAVKHRHSSVGIYWEVKPDVIKDLGLEDELKPMALPEATPEKTDGKKRKTSSNASESCEQPKKKKAKKSDSATKKQANLLAAFLNSKKK